MEGLFLRLRLRWRPSRWRRLRAKGMRGERAACRPDVMRFCKQVIKDTNDDVFSILNCLQSHRTRISRACNQVLVSHGQ